MGDFMISSRTPFYFVEAVFLDLMSLPGRLMDEEGNALWHLRHVCPRCSRWRKSFRDLDGDGARCLWKEQWGNGNYAFPRDFGFLNLTRYYLGMKTNLDRYVKLSAKGNSEEQHKL